jgi:hypothetical protein
VGRIAGERLVHAGDRVGRTIVREKENRQVLAEAGVSGIARQPAPVDALGRRGITQVAAQVALGERDLGAQVGQQRIGAAQRVERLVVPPEADVADRGLQERVAIVGRQRQHALEGGQRLVVAAQLAVLHAELGVRLRIVRPILDLLQQDPQVVFRLGAQHLLVADLAEMVNHPAAVDVDDRLRRIRRDERLVDAVREAQPRALAEQASHVGVEVAGIRLPLVIAARAGLPADDGAGEVVALDGRNGVEVGAGDLPADERVVARRNGLVRVERQDPVGRYLIEAEVAGGAEVVAPREVEHARAERPGDLDGAIGAAGVDDDEIVPQPADRLETLREVALFVPDDQADTKRRHSGGTSVLGG